MTGVRFRIDDALDQAHEQAESEGLKPSAPRPGGFRCDCPQCGGGRRRHDRVAVRPGETRAVVAFCHACATDLTAHFNGGAVELDPAEVARRRAQREQDRRETRRRLELVARALQPLDELPLEVLMWEPDRMPDSGVLVEQAGFVIRDDAGAIDGIDLYVPPFTPERARIDEEGGRKLIAVRGGRRGLWPRPQDVPDSAYLPNVLVAVEGPGTAATVLGLGLSAIAFSSSQGIRARDAERISSARWEFVLVLADADDVGRRGAQASLRSLRDVGLRARGVDLAPHLRDGTDAADLAREYTDMVAARAWLLRELEPFTEGTK